MDVLHSVHLVELCGSGQLFAMKAMDKNVMLNRNKVLKFIFFHPFSFEIDSCVPLFLSSFMYL